jgi:hypothetical protein
LALMRIQMNSFDKGDVIHLLASLRGLSKHAERKTTQAVAREVDGKLGAVQKWITRKE